MSTHLVLTLIGDDKPGLVEELSRTINANGGNWLDSSMSQLAGKFAGILLVNVAEGDVDKLVSALESMSAELKVVVEQAGPLEKDDSRALLQISLVGNDRPGIVREISGILAGQAVNVEQLNSSTEPAPMSAETLFRASALVRMPPGMGVDALQERLEQIADDLMVEIEQV